MLMYYKGKTDGLIRKRVTVISLEEIISSPAIAAGTGKKEARQSV